jgi:hypothetical protein
MAFDLNASTGLVGLVARFPAYRRASREDVDVLALLFAAPIGETRFNFLTIMNDEPLADCDDLI